MAAPRAPVTVQAITTSVPGAEKGPPGVPCPGQGGCWTPLKLVIFGTGAVVPPPPLPPVPWPPPEPVPPPVFPPPVPVPRPEPVPAADTAGAAATGAAATRVGVADGVAEGVPGAGEAVDAA